VSAAAEGLVEGTTFGVAADEAGPPRKGPLNKGRRVAVPVRRGQGDGSLFYEEARERWVAVLDLGLDGSGRRRRIKTTASTKTGARDKLRRLQAQAREDLLSRAPGPVPTLGSWLTFWVDNVASQRVRPSTLEGYRGYVHNRILPALGAHRLDELRAEHVHAFYRELSNSGLAPATVNQVHRILSRALKVAVQHGRATRNVASLVEPPTIRRTEIVPLTAVEVRQLLEAANGGRLAARWTVAVALGLRQGEALGLRWVDVDLGEGVLQVRQALQRRRGAGLQFVPPKSRAGQRRIALPVELSAQLQAHREHQDAERTRAGSAWRETGLVFTQPNGHPIDPRADHRSWQQLLTDAGVRRVRLHDARHTAATLLLAQGVPARVVMEVLGHSQISLTLGTYSHVNDDLTREAASRMSSALWGSPKPA